MTLAIGSDHAGFELKEYVARLLREDGHRVIDVGTNSQDSVDYPDYAAALTALVTGGKAEAGILVCGTGVGMCIAANKVRGIRAALVYDLYGAAQSRRHTDANVLVLAGQMTGKGLASQIVRTWLSTPFEGGRHARRLEKIQRLEHDFDGRREGKG